MGVFLLVLLASAPMNPSNCIAPFDTVAQANVAWIEEHAPADDIGRVYEMKASGTNSERHPSNPATRSLEAQSAAKVMSRGHFGKTRL